MRTDVFFKRPSRDHGVGPGQGKVQILHGIALVKAAGQGLIGAVDAADVGGTQGFGPLGEGCADVAGSDDGDHAAVNGADAAQVLPPVGGDDGVVFRDAAHEHQHGHKNVLADGDAVGPGGIGQDDAGVGVKILCQILLHARGGAGQPAQGRCRAQLFRGDVAVQDLALADDGVHIRLVGEVMDLEIVVQRDVFDVALVFAGEKIRFDSDGSGHECVTSKIMR